jgi:heme exporter protein D
VNEFHAAFLDAGGFEWPAFAASTLAIIVASIFTIWYQRRLRERDQLEREEKQHAAAEEKALKAALDSLNARLGTETFERQNAISELAAVVRVGDADLGRDVSEIREEMCHDYGQRDKSRPTFGRRQSGHD